jgi:hypothetical protein
MRSDKNESGLATFTTKSGRPYKLPKKISKPKTPAVLKTRMGSILAIVLLCFGLAKRKAKMLQERVL